MPDPAARVAWVGAEVAVQTNPSLRVAWVGAEVMVETHPPVRVAWVGAEVMVGRRRGPTAPLQIRRDDGLGSSNIPDIRRPSSRQSGEIGGYL